MSTGSVGRFIDSAAKALDGNGDKLRQTLAQLSGVGRILADGSGDIVNTITNLQTFVTALRDSNEQIVQFQDRFATLTSVVDDSRSDLDAALRNLSDVVGETTRFIEGTRDRTAEQIQRLANVTQNLSDHRMALENVLHIAPHSIANAVNMFDPRTGAASGVFVLNNMSNPVWFICGMIGALENVTLPGDRQALRAVPRTRAAPRELQQPAVPGQPVPDLQSAALHAAVQRAETDARRRGCGAAPAGNPARRLRVHRDGRRAATARLWPAAGAAAARGACSADRGHAVPRGTDVASDMLMLPAEEGHRHDRDERRSTWSGDRLGGDADRHGMRVPRRELVAAAGRGGAWR